MQYPGQKISKKATWRERAAMNCAFRGLGEESGGMGGCGV